MIECSPSQPNAARLLLDCCSDVGCHLLSALCRHRHRRFVLLQHRAHSQVQFGLLVRSCKENGSIIHRMFDKSLFRYCWINKPIAGLAGLAGRAAVPYLCSADRQRSVWPPVGVGYYSADFHFQKNPDRAHGTPLLLLSPEWQSIESTWK